jgi:rhamnogalacturonan endolyase
MGYSTQKLRCPLRLLPAIKLLAATLIVLWTAAALGADGPAVRVHQDTDQIEMENGLVRLVIDRKSKDLDSFFYRVNGREVKIGGMHYDANREGLEEEDSPAARAGLVRLFRQPSARLVVLQSGPDIAEVMVVDQASPRFAFYTEAHWILRRGDPGFYTYIIYRHGPGMAGISLPQARAVIGAGSGTNLFTYYLADDFRQDPFPTGQILETIQDETDRYANGQIYTKYDDSAFIADDLVYGMAGNEVGLWMILPGREYINGGPLHQELTVHRGLRGTGDTKGNILLWMFQGTHFGAGAIDLKAGQSWTMCYGPAFVYCNQGSSIAAMWQDAKQRAQAEQAAWPYAFVSDDYYPLHRTTVTGHIHMADGRIPKGAWVVLAPPGTNDWCMSAGGYEFWSKVDDSGAFSIPNVRAGRYTLFVSGGNEFVDYRQDGIGVFGDNTLDLGSLVWNPVTHGRTLWQIGIADRSTREFRNGNDVRHYDNFIRYIHDFSQDVTFTIGQSREDRDWNFAQWGWYAKKPYWTILFEEPKALSGQATLTLGVCASSHRRLEVTVNGHMAGAIDLPKTGGAPYRSAGQDSDYQVYPLTFDAGWIHAGTNEVTLAIKDAVPFTDPDQARPTRIGAVMYDAIRLEVQDGP